MAAYQIWLMRGISERKSLMFSLATRTEAEGDGLYAAEIAGMEDQLAASGRTPEEALENARLLFMATADDALRKGASISFATGQQAIALDIPIWQAPKFFHLLESKLNEQADVEEHAWLQILSPAELELQDAR